MFRSLFDLFRSKRKPRMIKGELCERGTIFKLEHPDGKLDILCYRGRGIFQENFVDINPKSKSFGILTIWGDDSEYAEWAISSAKRIGYLTTNRWNNKLIKSREKTERFLKEKLGITLE